MACDILKNNYCKKTNRYVTKAWCLERCENGKNLTTVKKQKTVIRKPNIAQMAIHFAKAMIYWASKGLPVCTKEAYTARRLICSECQPGKSCPFCGCNLWLKTAVETEKCELHKWKE